MDGLGIETAIEALVAEILKNGIINGVYDTGVFGGVGELVVVAAKFVAEEEAFFVIGIQAVVFVHLPDFLQAGLHGKVGLTEGNHFFAGVGILNDEITGVAGEFDSLNVTFGL